MDIQQALARVIEQQDLDYDEMRMVMHQIMTGEATSSQIGGFLIALRMKGESVNEVAGAASVMRELASSVTVKSDNTVDIVGTGGDGHKTFNISTASAIVTAAAGATVAKHGNRSVSSSSGSADLLEAVGVNLNLNADQVAACVDQIGIGFMFAVNHHAAMKHAIAPRKEMGVRTIFNVLGPLTNPAGAQNQLLGVYSESWLEPVAQVLQQLGSRHVMVVHSQDGLDEISISAKTDCVELKNGQINRRVIDPLEYGFRMAEMSEIVVADIAGSQKMVQEILNNQPGPALDIVLLNSGAAIYVAGLVTSLEKGIEKARQVITDGEARVKLDQLVNLSNNV